MDIDDIIEDFKSLSSGVKKSGVTGVVHDEKGRIASSKEKINEKGSLRDRIRKNKEDAETVARVEAIQRQEPYEEKTSDDMNEIDKKVAEEIVDRIVYKTILKDK